MWQNSLLLAWSYSEWLFFLSKINYNTKLYWKQISKNQFLNTVINTEMAPKLLVCWLWTPFYFQWIPELKHYAPGVPIILVGTKLGKNDLVLIFFEIQPSDASFDRPNDWTWLYRIILLVIYMITVQEFSNVVNIMWWKKKICTQ